MTQRLPLLIIGLAMFPLVTVSLGEPNRLQAESPAMLEIAAFSAAIPGGYWPDGWKPLTFPKIPQHTTYSLVKDGERNVYEDYKWAFGEEPPMISGVAIMTDTDNTRESAEAFYGDIVFKKRVE